MQKNFYIRNYQYEAKQDDVVLKKQGFKEIVQSTDFI